MYDRLHSGARAIPCFGHRAERNESLIDIERSAYDIMHLE